MLEVNNLRYFLLGLWFGVLPPGASRLAPALLCAAANARKFATHCMGQAAGTASSSSSGSSCGLYTVAAARLQDLALRAHTSVLMSSSTASILEMAILRNEVSVIDDPSVEAAALHHMAAACSLLHLQLQQASSPQLGQQHEAAGSISIAHCSSSHGSGSGISSGSGSNSRKDSSSVGSSGSSSNAQGGATAQRRQQQQVAAPSIPDYHGAFAPAARRAGVCIMPCGSPLQKQQMAVPGLMITCGSCWHAL